MERDSYSYQRGMRIARTSASYLGLELSEARRAAIIRGDLMDAGYSEAEAADVARSLVFADDQAEEDDVDRT